MSRRSCQSENQKSFPNREIENQECLLLMDPLRRLWGEDDGQDIAEYAVMLAIILVVVVGTIRLIGSSSNSVFSTVSSSLP